MEPCSLNGVKDKRGILHRRFALLALAVKSDYNSATVLDIKESRGRIKEDLHFARIA
jgi:hypothetical protein